MEALLSLSFDNIASKDSVKIRKGLRQIEGLLAQICLSSGGGARPSTPSQHRRTGSAMPLGQQMAQSPSPKKLGALVEDPAFREFFRLQEGFEWNDGQNDLLILSALSNLQGLLLLHPPSRKIFGSETSMNLLLDLLDPYNCPAIQCSTLLVLVTALLATPHNTRTFENIDGLLTITTLFKSRSTSQNVKLKLLEFLYFYLMPEAPERPASAPTTALRSADKLVGAFERRSSEEKARQPATREETTRSTEEKQNMLGKYLNNVEDLVEDLRENAPFSEVACN
ncbi:cell division control 14, SIN component [Delitschia confertaspora ATCC 74209]|uniref:Cell division control 14, SIN component n=1 Tax=Delitschia confertaspora ATCC 74209 TaxID=1513339 RepID=A0A9P4JSR3_9PLEO|nr:cell division control 14, SIN component [Delitschia confertaspora ATCC 74209]